MLVMPTDETPEREAGDERSRPGQKLTKGQRAILIRLIAAHYYVDAVRDALAEEYPEFPDVSDRLIRYYRQQIDADVLIEAQTAREQVLQASLANKAVRVKHLIRMVEQWRHVPLVEAIVYVDDSGQKQTAYRTREAASREMRELLKQIAQELGEFTPSAPAGAGAGASLGSFGENAEEDDLADADLRADLQEILNAMAEREAASAGALAAAVRFGDS